MKHQKMLNLLIEGSNSKFMTKNKIANDPSNESYDAGNKLSIILYIYIYIYISVKSSF